MRLLLDTQIILWALRDDPRLSRRWRDLISDSDNEIFVSVASIWEAEIKHAAGKLDLPDDLAAMIQRFGCAMLDIEPDDARRAARLPPHHRDPFDRMIIAQAIGRGLTILTSDAAFSNYDIEMAPK